MQLNKEFKISVIKGLVIGIILNIIVIGSIVAIYHRFYERIPSLTGINYYSDVNNKLRYKHLSFHITEIPGSQSPVGTIIEQNPAANEMITKVGKDVYISIAAPNETMIMPDIVNDSYSSVELSLKNCNAEIMLVPQMSMTKAFGTVLKTNPAAGQPVSPGSTIIVYYASDESLVEVPNLIGYNVKTAKNLLESVGLVLDPKYEYVNSPKKKGTVVYQSFDKSQKIPAGYSVSVRISTGKTDPVTTEITIKLPHNKLACSQPVKIYLNNNRIYSKNLLMDGSNYSFSVSGSGASNTVKVVIDNTNYYTCKVNFNQTPVKITEVQYLNPSVFNPEKTEIPATTFESTESTNVSAENTTTTQPQEATSATTSIFDLIFR